MRRYHITTGAKTTVGGIVQSTTTPATIDGQRIALEGDTICCPRCKKIGKIVCVSPRHTQRILGKMCALSNDICSCGCFPPPRLLANQSVRYQSFLSEQSAAASNTSIATSLLSSEFNDLVPEELEQYFLVIKEDRESPSLTYVVRANGVVLDRGEISNGSKTDSRSIQQDLEFTCWVHPT